MGVVSTSVTLRRDGVGHCRDDRMV